MGAQDQEQRDFCGVARRAIVEQTGKNRDELAALEPAQSPYREAARLDPNLADGLVARQPNQKVQFGSRWIAAIFDREHQPPAAIVLGQAR